MNYPFNTRPSPQVSHQWRTSSILSFAHNLALVVVRCREEVEPLQLVAYHQERPVVVPGLCGREMCPLDGFLDKVRRIADGVDFEQVCQYET